MQWDELSVKKGNQYFTTASATAMPDALNACSSMATMRLRRISGPPCQINKGTDKWISASFWSDGELRWCNGSVHNTRRVGGVDLCVGAVDVVDSVAKGGVLFCRGWPGLGSRMQLESWFDRCGARWRLLGGGGAAEGG